MAGRNKDERNIVPLNTTIPKETKDDLQELSKTHGSISAVIVELVKEEKKRLARKKKP